MGYAIEIEELTLKLQECVSNINVSFEDDLEGILTWLNPNEPNNNHQLRPPSLRLKNGIKLLLDNNDMPNTFIDLMREYVFLQTRVHFFSHFKTLKSFKEVQKLEKYYEFPLKYINLFSPEEWGDELNGFRAYLISNNLPFRKGIEQRLKQLIMEDEFDMATKIYFWICQAMDYSLLYLIIDILMDKVCIFANQKMSRVWSKRYVVMETFNSFISKYWSNFATMLKCAEDEHDITTEIFNCFEREFLRIRTSEVFEIFVTKYPESGPTLLELRNVLKSPEDYTHLISEFLLKFEEKRMNPSVTTAEILLSYVTAVKSILTVDATGRYFQLLTNFIRPYVMERRDAVTTFLYAMLELDVVEINDPNVTSTHMEVLNKLSRQLKYPEFGAFEGSSPIEKKNGTINTYVSTSFDDDRPLHEQILNRFLQWTPEPSGTIRGKANGLLMNKNLLDIILEIFDSKDIVINEFLALFTKKLFALKYYKLDPKWTGSLKLLRKKFDLKTYPNGQDVSNINNIDVMLRDVKQSEELCLQMHSMPELNDKIFPKFISYLFWDTASELQDKQNEFNLPPWLRADIEKYTGMYTQIKPGRSLHLHKHQGTVELNLKFEDGRTLEVEVPFDKAAVISCFDNVKSSLGVTLQQIVTHTGLNESTVKAHLQFWLESSAVYFDSDNGVYRSLENYDQVAGLQGSLVEREANAKMDSIAANTDMLESIHDKQHQEFIDSMSKVWPFIQGMLTNLGSLKVEKIHSFLKMAVPKEVGYSATLVQLESYLNILVDEEKVISAANGSYKLSR